MPSRPPIISPIFAAILAAIAFLALAPPSRAEWRTFVYRGRTYVYAEDVAAFYRMKYARDGKALRFSTEGLEIKAVIGSKELWINGTKFYLSYPVVTMQAGPVISAFDLSHLIDAVIRPSTRRRPIELKRVIIDAAHGGTDPGREAQGEKEKDLTLAIAKALAERVRQMGLEPVLVRDADLYLDPADRAALANVGDEGACLISIDLNYSESKSSSGIETYALPPSGTPATYDDDGAKVDRQIYLGNVSDAENIALATSVHSSVAASTKMDDLGIKRARFPLLKRVNVPAILLRPGFMSHPAEGEKLADPAFHDQIAAAVAAGIGRFAKAMRRGSLQPPKQALKIADATGAPTADGVKAELAIEVVGGAAIDPAKVDLQVFGFDLVNGEQIDLTYADPPAITWKSVLPDWKATPKELLDFQFKLPTPDQKLVEDFGSRRFFGYVVRLIYDGELQDMTASQPNLDRGLHHFAPAFPR
ncbi:MAG: N-acetylmuramoyl-L-alanine amidase [Verrucomicrobiales bacterium]